MQATHILAALAFAAVSIPAMADTQCTSRLSGSFENIDVPAGATCTLVNAHVDGTVKVYGKLRVLDGRRGTLIDGNIQAEPGNMGVEIGKGVEINGDVQIVEAFGPTVILEAFIGGSVQYKESYAKLTVRGATIGSDLQMEKTTVAGAPSGSIFFNTIDGNLQCQENYLAPVGGGNVVGGNKEDQCAGF